MQSKLFLHIYCVIFLYLWWDKKKLIQDSIYIYICAEFPFLLYFFVQMHYTQWLRHESIEQIWAVTSYWTAPFEEPPCIGSSGYTTSVQCIRNTLAAARAQLRAWGLEVLASTTPAEFRSSTQFRMPVRNTKAFTNALPTMMMKVLRRPPYSTLQVCYIITCRDQVVKEILVASMYRIFL